MCEAGASRRGGGWGHGRQLSWQNHLQSPAMSPAFHLPAIVWMFTTLTVGALVWTLAFSAPCVAQQNLPGYMSVKAGSQTVPKSSSTARPTVPPAPPTCAMPAGKLATASNTPGACALKLHPGQPRRRRICRRRPSRGRLAAGTAHAAVGGVFMTWAAEREAKVRREVAAAVEAYNRCKLHRTF